MCFRISTRERSCSLFVNILFTPSKLPAPHCDREEGIAAAMQRPYSPHLLTTFYASNEVVLDMYKKSAIKESASAQCEAIKKDVELLQEIVDRKRGDTGTPFECPPDHHTYNWRENDWTKRLVPGI